MELHEAKGLDAVIAIMKKLVAPRVISEIIVQETQQEPQQLTPAERKNELLDRVAKQTAAARDAVDEIRKSLKK